jgi:hypothetical protein
MNITPLEAIQRIVSSGDDAWESIVTLANSSENDMASRRWLIGDLALLVRTEYGKNRIADFATKANLARSTVSQYKNVSAFYPSDVRYLYEGVSYAHFRCAMRLKELAFQFLDECSSLSYTVEQAQIEVTKRLGKPAPPLMLLDAEGCIGHVNPWNSDMVIQLAEGVDVFAIEKLQGKNVRIKIYELEGE